MFKGGPVLGATEGGNRWLASSSERPGCSLEHPRGMPSQWDMLRAWALLAISFPIFWEEKHPHLLKNEVSFFFLLLFIVLFVCCGCACKSQTPAFSNLKAQLLSSFLDGRCGSNRASLLTQLSQGTRHIGPACAEPLPAAHQRTHTALCPLSGSRSKDSPL